MSAWQTAQKEIEDQIGKENIECMMNILRMLQWMGDKCFIRMTFKKILKKLINCRMKFDKR